MKVSVCTGFYSYKLNKSWFVRLQKLEGHTLSNFIFRSGTSRLLYFLTFLFFMIPLSEQYRINIKNAIELIDNTLVLVRESKKKWNEEDAKYTNFGQKGKVFLDFNIKTLEDIRKAIAKKPYEKLP